MKRSMTWFTLMTWYLIAGLIITSCVITPQGFVPLQLVRGSGEVEVLELDVARFDRVEVQNAFQVTIRQGEPFHVVVEVDTALLPRLDVNARGNTLQIGLEPGVSPTGNVTLRAEVTMPELHGLVASGASQVDLAGFSSSASLELEASGASRVTAEIDAGDTRLNASGASQVTLNGAREDLSLVVSGASRVTLHGAGNNATIQATGASNVDLADFPVEDADIIASGASSITVQADGRLDANASGASTVSYLGNPTLGNLQTSGGSSVRPR